MKLLSNINIGMAVGLLVFVLFTGSTVFLLRAVVETFGLYITNLLPMASWNDTLARYSSEGGALGWQGSWTVFYWAWTVTWPPFIGIFVARISRGRTIREFVLGVLFALYRGLSHEELSEVRVGSPPKQEELKSED